MQAQFSNATAFDRYPGLMLALKRMKGSAKAGSRPLRILSYGCSIGEELITLRLYFPDAEIFGCDVNEGALKIASGIAEKVDATVFKSTDASLREHGPFDIVTAMSVLCLHPAKDIIKRFPFSAYEHNIGVIDEALSDGGLFALFNSSYLFRGTTVAEHYQPMAADTVGSNGFATRHARNGDVLATRIASDFGLSYKVDDIERIRFEDFMDCIYKKRSGEKWPDRKYIKVDQGFDCSETNIAYSWSKSEHLDDIDQKSPEGIMDMRVSFRLIKADKHQSQLFSERATSRRDLWHGGYRGKSKFICPAWMDYS